MMRFAPLAVLVLLIALFIAGIGQDTKEPELALANKAVPEIEIDGIDRQELVQGIVVVNFFASWCVSCVSEQKVLQDLHTQNPDLKMIGIAYKDNAVKTAQWLERHGNPFDVVGHDPQGSAGLEWGVTGVPETYIIKDGTVLARHVGALDTLAANNLLTQASP